MRRFFSITAMVAVALSALTPLLAAACPHVQPAACHRVQAQKPHCEMMHHHDADAAVVEDEAPAFASNPSADCPMDCCIPGHPKNAITAMARPELPPLAVVERVFYAVPVVFTRHGFSSHTDRGPPTA